MRATIVAPLLFFLMASFPALSEQATLYVGLNSRLVKITDEMTDHKGCAIFADWTVGYFAIHGDDSFVFWLNSPTNHIDGRGENLARADGHPAFPLKLVRPTDGLASDFSATKANANFISRLVNGESVKIRYTLFPGMKSITIDGNIPGLNIAYKQGVVKCGWKDIVLSEDLPPVELSVYSGDDNYASVSVAGTRSDWKSLKLTRSRGSLGQKCMFEVGGTEDAFGVKDGTVVAGSNYSLTKKTLRIKDGAGKLIFEEDIPKVAFGEPAPWKHTKRALESAKTVSPYGIIEIYSPPTTRFASLYGFPELWSWGVKNCGLPK